MLQMPSAVWMAIERTAWRPQIDYPRIRSVRFTGAALAEGVTRHRIESTDIPITDPARTVVDCFRYQANRPRRRDGGAARGPSPSQLHPRRTLALRAEGSSLVGDALTSKRWQPMPRKSRNIGASVGARLLDRARVQRSDFQILLTRYALERLLYRLTISAHRDRFVLKGAMLFATWVADPFRPTRDLDLLGYGDYEAEPIAETFRAMCAEPVTDDGVVFDVAGLGAAPIRKGAHDRYDRRRADPDPGRYRLR